MLLRCAAPVHHSQQLPFEARQGLGEAWQLGGIGHHKLELTTHNRRAATRWQMLLVTHSNSDSNSAAYTPAFWGVLTDPSQAAGIPGGIGEPSCTCKAPGLGYDSCKP